MSAGDVRRDVLGHFDECAACGVLKEYGPAWIYEGHDTPKSHWISLFRFLRGQAADLGGSRQHCFLCWVGLRIGLTKRTLGEQENEESHESPRHGKAASRFWANAR